MCNYTNLTFAQSLSATAFLLQKFPKFEDPEDCWYYCLTRLGFKMDAGRHQQALNYVIYNKELKAEIPYFCWFLNHFYTDTRYDVNRMDIIINHWERFQHFELCSIVHPYKTILEMPIINFTPLVYRDDLFMANNFKSLNKSALGMLQERINAKYFFRCVYEEWKYFQREFKICE